MLFGFWFSISYRFIRPANQRQGDYKLFPIIRKSFLHISKDFFFPSILQLGLFAIAPQTAFKGYSMRFACAGYVDTRLPLKRFKRKMECFFLFTINVLSNYYLSLFAIIGVERSVTILIQIFVNANENPVIFSITGFRNSFVITELIGNVNFVSIQAIFFIATLLLIFILFII
jgi:hypothetical protein